MEKLRSLLSPFSGSGGDISDPSRSPQNNLQDELLVDISDIQPAGDNKDLFSIDEDSREGTPSKSSEFQVVELSDENIVNCSNNQELKSPLNNHNAYNPAFSGMGASSIGRRKGSDGSEVSSLFPIYEVPGVSFNVPQSDIESCSSEWEDSSSSGTLDRLSKDTVYQAYLRMRQRYHKYKGRYSDILRVIQEKEKESEKLRDVLTKQQDKAVRRISELREQCSLEQQAKAHLEQELRSDLEEKDHKIEALQTKVRLLQEGCFGEGPLKSLNAPSEGANPPNEEGAGSGAPSLQGELTSVIKGQTPEDFDSVSVGSLGSISTVPPSLESEDLIEKLKEDLMKHKTLLSRCMENIRANKERIILLTQERDTANNQLQEKILSIDSLKVDHERMLESLRATVESSALSMAETKQQFFEELQTKEEEVERYKKSNLHLQRTNDRLMEAPQPSEEETEINMEAQGLAVDEESAKDLKNKCTELENLVADLQSTKKNLEVELEQTKISLENQAAEESSEDGASIEELRKDLEAETNKWKALYNEYRTKKEGLESLNNKLETKISNLLEELTATRENCSQLEREKEDLSGLLKASQDQTETLEGAKDELNNKLQIISKLNNELNEEKSTISRQLTEITEQNVELTPKVAKLKIENEELSSELRNLNDENESLNSEVSGLNDENESLHSDYKQLQKDHDVLTERLKEESDAATQRDSQVQTELKEVKETLLDLEGEKEAAEKTREKGEEDMAILEKDNKALQEKIEVLEEEKLDYVNIKESLGIDINRIRSEKSGLENEKLELENDKKTLDDEKQTLEKENLILRKNLEERIELSQKLEDDLKSAKEQLNKNDQISFLENKIENLDKEIYTLKDNEKELREELKGKEEIEERLKEIENDWSNDKETKIKLENLFAEVEDTLSSQIEYCSNEDSLGRKLEKIISAKINLENKILDLSQTMSKQEKEILEREKEVERLKQFENVNNEKEQVNEQFRLLEIKYKEINLEKEEFKKCSEENAHEMERLKNAINSVKRENENAVTELNGKISEYENNIRGLNTTIRENEGLISTLKENENICQELSNKLREKETLIADLNLKLHENEKIIFELKVELDKNENTISELNSKLEENEKKLSEVVEKLEENKKRERELEQEMEHIFKDLENTKTKHKEELKKLTDELTKTQQEYDKISKDKFKDAENYETKMALMIEEKESLVGNLEALSRDSNKLEEFVNQLHETKSHLSHAEEEKKRLNAENQSFRSQLEAMTDERREWQERVSKDEGIWKEKEKELQISLSEVNKKLENAHEEKDDIVREKEDAIKTKNYAIQEKEEAIREKEDAIKEKDDALRQNEDDIREKEDAIREKEDAIREKEDAVKEKEDAVREKEDAIKEKDDALRQNEDAIREKGDAIREKEDAIREKEDAVKEKEDAVREKEDAIKEKDDALRQNEDAIREKEDAIREKEDAIREKEDAIREKEIAISEKEEAIKEKIDTSREKEDTTRQKDQIEKEKDDLELVVKEMEEKMSELEEIHLKKRQEVEEDWQRKVRLQHLNDSFAISSRSLALCNMMRVSCELEKLQAEHDQRLAKAACESFEKEEEKIAQCASEEDSLRRSLSRKDAELASLMDGKDALQVLLDEKEEELRLALLQWEEEKKKRDEEVICLREKLLTTESQMEKQVQEMESSNTDLRQKIDALQSELSCLEGMTKECSSVVEERVAEQTQLLEEGTREQIALLTQKVQQMEEAEKNHLTNISKIEEEKEALRKETEIQMALCEELSLKTEALKKEMESKMNRLEEDLGQESSKNSVLLKQDEERVFEREALFAEVNRLKSERDILTTNLENLQEEHKTSTELLKKQIQELSLKCQEQEDLNGRLSDASSSLKDQLHSLESKVTHAEDRLSSCHRAVLTHLEESRTEQEEGDIDFESVLRSFSVDRSNLQVENKRMQQVCEDESNALKRLKETLKGKEEEINALNEQLNDANTKTETPTQDASVEGTISASSITDTESATKEEQEFESAIEKCKEEFYAEYDMKVTELKCSQDEEKRKWEAATEERVLLKEAEMNARIKKLTRQWHEERKELERLAKVAAEAFRSGASSVDLLKDQITAQVNELDGLKRSHRKEIGELQALLEVKRRRGRGGHGEVKGGGTLEESAEFEYLKNILYQYMIGKETQTLSKVLCAVVKFSTDQQRQIVEHEDRKQNLLKEAELIRKSVAREKSKRKS